MRIREIYKPIIINNEKTNYLVSTNGNVKNSVTCKVLKPKITKDGYCEVGLYHNGKVYHRRVHRLVAIAFIPNPENKPTVNHKDTNTLNNDVDNLEWATVEEQISYSFEFGNRKHKQVKTHKKSSYTDEQIHVVCKLLEENNLTQKEIMYRTGVLSDTIRAIRKHKHWTRISDLYNIDNFNKSVPYPPDLRNAIINSIHENKSNSEIRYEFGLDNTIKTKHFLRYLRKTNQIKHDSSTTIENEFNGLTIDINIDDKDRW